MTALFVAAVLVGGDPAPMPVALPPMPIALPSSCPGGCPLGGGGVQPGQCGSDRCPGAGWPGRCPCVIADEAKQAAVPAPVPLRSFVDARSGCTYTETAPGSGQYVRTSCPARR